MHGEEDSISSLEGCRQPLNGPHSGKAEMHSSFGDTSANTFLHVTSYVPCFLETTFFVCLTLKLHKENISTILTE